MFSIPSSRKFLLAALSLLSLALIYRLLLTAAAPLRSRTAIARTILSRIPRATPVAQDENVAKYMLPIPDDASQTHLSPPQRFYYNSSSQKAPDLAYLTPLLACPLTPNQYTKHIRLPNLVHNVSTSFTPPGAAAAAAQSDTVRKFNPTIIALPHWSANQYLLVSRVVTEGLHQESLICEANIYRPANTTSTSSNDGSAAAKMLNSSGWELRCATEPVMINIPPTPAARCTGSWAAFADIPGFHDPRVFWSGSGEPLIIVNSASRYGCVGLWVVDLRAVYEPLGRLWEGGGDGEGDEEQGGRGKKQRTILAYSCLTELTRNPREDRSDVEKNWMLFFPGTEGEAFVHYDMVSSSAHRDDDNDDSAGSNRSATSTTKATTGKSGRSFAKLIGNGYTTPNLADPDEASCFDHETKDALGERGHWHQGSNALKLMLCTRREARDGLCGSGGDDSNGKGEAIGRTVHFAVMHRKFSNAWHLPLRYERWFVVWEGREPFRLLAKSRFPVLFENETASGLEEEAEGEDIDEENGWEGDDDSGEAKDMVRRQQEWRGTNAAGELEHHSGSNATLRWTNSSFISNSSSSSILDDRNILGSSHTATNASSQHVNDGPPVKKHRRKKLASFTYTPSIAWAWRPKSAEIRREDGDGSGGSHLHTMHVGYLDDEVIVGIGLDDVGQAFAKVEARVLLQCLEICPGAEV